MLLNEVAALLRISTADFNGACSTTAVVVVALMVAAYWLCWFFHLGRGSKAVPYAPIGFRELVRTAATKESAWGLLGLRESSGLLTFRLRIPVPKGFYMVGDYTLAREILNDKDSDKPSSVYQQIRMHKSKGDMFVGPNSAHWKMARQSAIYAFSPKEVKRMTSICEIHVQKLISKLQKLEHNAETFNVCYEMPKFAFDFFCEAALEYKTSESDYKEFAAHLEGFKDFVRFESKKLLGFISRFYIPTCRPSTGKHIRDFARKIYNNYLDNPNKSKNNTLIRLIAETEGLTDEERIDEIMMLSVAGHETTGTTLSSILVALAKNPSVAEKLQEQLSMAPPGSHGAQGIPYFQHVVQEAMRVMPLTGVSVFRKTSKAFAVPKTSQIIPKGAIVGLSPLLMFYNSEVFADPGSFNPDRWANPSKDMKESFIPFAVGQRSCLGRALATAEINTLIPALLANFDFSIAEEGDTDFCIFLAYTGVKLHVTKRIQI